MDLTRRRNREGFVGFVRPKVRRSEVAALIARGLLAEAAPQDRVAVALVLGEWLDRALGTR
jgi:hypothetical protein